MPAENLLFAEFPWVSIAWSSFQIRAVQFGFAINKLCPHADAIQMLNIAAHFQIQSFILPQRKIGISRRVPRDIFHAYYGQRSRYHTAGQTINHQHKQKHPAQTAPVAFQVAFQLADKNLGLGKLLLGKQGGLCTRLLLWSSEICFMHHHNPAKDRMQISPPKVVCKEKAT